MSGVKKKLSGSQKRKIRKEKEYNINSKYTKLDNFLISASSLSCVSASSSNARELDEQGQAHPGIHKRRICASKLGLDGSFTFLQDYDPKHTARVVREWLLYNVRKQVKTPPQSPGLNPIEHLWDFLDRQIRKQEIKTKNDLTKALLEELQKIPSSVTQNFVKSVPSRLRAVIKAKDYPTNY
ncbi:transposable element Tcb2 transposase [Trichonephila clavipes]|nr:transposable element Tcb2 transposase [Trichonephila clavipes]